MEKNMPTATDQLTGLARTRANREAKQRKADVLDAVLADLGPTTTCEQAQRECYRRAQVNVSPHMVLNHRRAMFPDREDHRRWPFPPSRAVEVLLSVGRAVGKCAEPDDRAWDIVQALIADRKAGEGLDRVDENVIRFASFVASIGGVKKARAILDAMERSSAMA
jgi:hypothetical protein